MRYLAAGQGFVFLGLSSSLAAAQQVPAARETAEMATTSAMLLQVTLGLLAVIALILVLAWVAKRTRLIPGGSHQGALKVLAVLPLSNRERLALVQVGDQQLLLGVTAQQINCLHRLEKPLEPHSPSDSASFAQLLNQWKKTRMHKGKQDEG